MQNREEENDYLFTNIFLVNDVAFSFHYSFYSFIQTYNQLAKTG